MLTGSTEVIVGTGPAAEHRTTWGAFQADNAEWLDAAEKLRIIAALIDRATYHGGGGASAEWTIRLSNGENQ